MLNSILEAIEEGRLIELPDNDKKDSLEFLGSLLEAIPSVPAGTDIVGNILLHEKSSNTSLGIGWACPHAKVEHEGDLLCAIGWSPVGINYGKPGEPKVGIIVMFLVPDNQRSRYLKEVSTLVKVINKHPEYKELDAFQDLNNVRLRLLDMAHFAMEESGTDTLARMIQLRTRAETSAAVGASLEGMEIEAVSIVTGKGLKPIILTQSGVLADLTRNDNSLAAAITNRGAHDLGGWRFVCRNSVHYTDERIVYECLAIRPTRKK